MSVTDYIDWSCKHDILLKNPDGTYSPMDEPYFRSEKVCDGVWKILSAGDHSYLVEGDREAISIDTGYGAGNIRQYLQTLTDKPVENVINTHDHFDHTANNAYFEKAYMSRPALPLSTIPYPSFAGIDFPQNYPRVLVEDGDVIDLGGRTLEIFAIPDHTPSGIAMLDRKGRIFFTGDELMDMPMGKKLNVGLTTFRGYLLRMEEHRSEFDLLCAGEGVRDASLVDRYLECVEYILAGHEGEEFNPGAGKPPKGGPQGGAGIQFHQTEYVDGKMVYDRIFPHPGDGGPGKGKPVSQGNTQMRRMYHADIQIIYDALRVNE